MEIKYQDDNKLTITSHKPTKRVFYAMRVLEIERRKLMFYFNTEEERDKYMDFLYEKYFNKWHLCSKNYLKKQGVIKINKLFI